MTEQSPQSRGEVALFVAPDGAVTLDVRLERESLWLSLDQIAALFERDKSVISRHLRNIFAGGELERGASVAKNATVQIERGREVNRQIEYYNLDAIISVGYRVNSKRGTQFRIWASGVLRDHLLEGYSLNASRLRELQRVVHLTTETAKRLNLEGDEASALLQVIGGYSRALDLLDDHDHQRVQAPDARGKVLHLVDYDEAIRIVETLRERFGASSLFGV